MNDLRDFLASIDARMRRDTEQHNTVLKAQFKAEREVWRAKQRARSNAFYEGMRVRSLARRWDADEAAWRRADRADNRAGKVT